MSFLIQLARPIFIPIGCVGVGLSYGTFKLTTKALRVFLPGDKSPESYRKSTYITGLGSGFGVFILRDYLSAISSNNHIIKHNRDQVNVATLTRFGRIKANILLQASQLRLRHRAVSLVIASLTAGVVVEIIHMKNLNQ